MGDLDLGWGDPYFLLEILDNMYKPHFGFQRPKIKSMNYAPTDGKAKLLDCVRAITEHTTGNRYNYYIITNGATQALNTIMRAWHRFDGIDTVITGKFGYPYYPHMIKKNDLIHNAVDLKGYEEVWGDAMAIVDSPANPFGNQFQGSIKSVLDKKPPIVWDAVYHNTIYNACPAIQPDHSVYVGSFSKLLGLTGARIGWIATNCPVDYRHFSEEAMYENATISKPSQNLITDVLNNINLDEFMHLGKNSLDQNRESLHKLSYLLGTDVQEKGMFYCAEVDDKMLKLFDKAEVKYIEFKDKNKKFIRLNIGQTNGIINKAVEAVQKVDGVGRAK